MNFRKSLSSCDQVRQMDIVSYLSSLGYQPAKITNCDYWYFSPLRAEKTPSFKVNKNINRWYDHGMGKGGNLIDFAILYNNCTVGEFLKTIDFDLPIYQPKDLVLKQEFQTKEKSITIIKTGSLRSYALHRYLCQRRIPFEVARQFCQEVTYRLSGRTYFGIGFKNNSGGYELRNSLFKCSSSPKDMTTIRKQNRTITVFEGFFDFLSFLSLNQNSALLRTDFLVLNSTSFFERARPFMEKYQVVDLYLDRDRTGQNCTRYALSLSKKYNDKSELYCHYKDLNDWLMNIGKAQRPTLE